MRILKSDTGLILILRRSVEKHLYIFLFLIMALVNGCITEFIPSVTEPKELLVVEGLITDQFEADTIKLSMSMPLGMKSEATPLSGCIVKISDNLGNIYSLAEKKAGKYVTDPATFRGVVGRSYTLHISAWAGSYPLNYESFPAEMKPVPPIDSIYYEKTVIRVETQSDSRIDGCSICLNAIDPENQCKFYRWDFSETWVLRLLWPVENMTCWITENSKSIDIKSTDAVAETSIERHQVTYITNETDRLTSKYSILVNQYSLNEDEFTFWEKLQNLTQQNGGLYDIIPSTIPSNLQCIERPDQAVLGYFSVSAKSSKRIYIKDEFSGTFNPYANCVSDTIPTDYPEGETGFGTLFWALFIQKGSFTSPPFTIITDIRGCADCTVRGSNIKPDFWEDDK